MKTSETSRKPYKAKIPIVTINNIRKTLEKCSIFTIEQHYGINSNLDIYSCRIFIANNKLQSLSVGTNGKGITPAYSLASGYGEFMERLQVGSLFPGFVYYFERKRLICSNQKNIISNTENSDFCYSPEEMIISFKEFSDNCPEEIATMLKAATRKNNVSLWQILDENNPITISLPFFNVNRNKVVNLPVDIVRAVTGTNGTCAGNTPEEALIQGLCEILERFVLKKIFFEKTVPPDIPLTFFNNTKSGEIIDKIVNSGNYEIRIKDCSLGMGLPVMGILLIDKDEHKYMFRLGADPRPEIALERCLTESHQGLDSLKSNFQSIEEASHFDESYTIHQDKFRENYLSFVANGKGYVPSTVFHADSSSSFSGFNSEFGKSDSSDLQLLTNKIISLGYSIFVRDHSFLGFPSYHIVIPGMSDMHGNYSPLPHESYTYFDTLCNLKNNTDNNLLELAEYLKDVTDKEIKMGSFFSTFFPPTTEPEFKNNEKHLFLAMIYYQLEKFTDAYEYMKKFLKEDDENIIDNKVYFYCIRDYFKSTVAGKSESEIKKRLIHIYDKNTVDEVINDLKDPKKIFSYYNLPSCFDCNSCEFSGNCSFNELYKLFTEVKKKQKENVIDQSKLTDVFSF